jgi:hypothetical protein
VSPRKPMEFQQRSGWTPVSAFGYVVHPDLRIAVAYTLSDFDNTDTSWSVGGIVDADSKPIRPAYGPRESAATSARSCVKVCKKTGPGPCKSELLQTSCCGAEGSAGEAEYGLQRIAAAVNLCAFPTSCRSKGFASSLYCWK